MNDNDLLDLIAERAPAPASDYADRVLVAGRRARRRRRLAIAGTVLCAVVAVVTPVGLWAAGSDHAVVEVSQTAPAGVDSTDVYVAAISGILSDAMPAAEIARFDLADHLCANVLELSEPCDAEPLPADARLGLPRSESWRVELVPRDTAREQHILITLGPIHWVRPDLAEVPISFRQRPAYDRAATYRVQLRDGQWVATGHR